MLRLHPNIEANPQNLPSSLTAEHHTSPSDGLLHFGPFCFIAVKALATNENTYLLVFLVVAKKKLK
jgi:hypothetical protein